MKSYSRLNEKKSHTIFTVLPDSGTFGRGWLIGVWSQVEISPRDKKKRGGRRSPAQHFSDQSSPKLFWAILPTPICCHHLICSVGQTYSSRLSSPTERRQLQHRHEQSALTLRPGASGAKISPPVPADVGLARPQPGIQHHSTHHRADKPTARQQRPEPDRCPSPPPSLQKESPHSAADPYPRLGQEPPPLPRRPAGPLHHRPHPRLPLPRPGRRPDPPSVPHARRASRRCTTSQ